MQNNNNISLLIAIPCYGGQLTSETVTGLYKLTKHLERINIFNELLLISNESLIPHGRATIANVFMNDTNHTHLMMIDADVGFEPEDVIKLLELEVDFAAGAYPMKVLPDQYNFCIINKEFNKDHTAIVASTIGTGFNLVTRKVFEDISIKYPQLKYIPVDKSIGYRVSNERLNNSFAYFETYIDPNTYHLISEDFAFNIRYNSTGGKIWLRTDIKLTHTGSYVFQGRDFSNYK